jgi:hypothetical protein
MQIEASVRGWQVRIIAQDEMCVFSIGLAHTIYLDD